MELTIYDNASDFLAQTQAHLAADEASNNLILGVCLRLKQFPERIEQQPYLATVTQGSHIILIAVMTPPYNLIVYATQPDIEVAADLLCQNLIATQWPFPGVVGPIEAAKSVAIAWTELTGGRYEVAMRQRIYALHAVNPPRPAAGQLRVATESDITWLSEWIDQFHIEAMNEHQPEKARSTAEQKTRDGDLYIWENEISCAMAVKTRPLLKSIAVSLVYTPPELRGQGYASACVAGLSQLLLDEGWQFCTLFTDLANPTSNSIYQRIGYKPVGDFRMYKFV